MNGGLGETFLSISEIVTSLAWRASEDDWHGELVCALKAALAKTQNRTVERHAKGFLEVLSEIDECKHVVTAMRIVSTKFIDPQFAITHAEAALKGVPCELNAQQNGHLYTLHLTMTARGSRAQAQLIAERCISHGLERAYIAALSASRAGVSDSDACPPTPMPPFNPPKRGTKARKRSISK